MLHQEDNKKKQGTLETASLLRPLLGFGFGFFESSITRMGDPALSQPIQLTDLHLYVTWSAAVVNFIKKDPPTVLTLGFVLGMAAGVVAEAVYNNISLQFSM